MNKFLGFVLATSAAISGCSDNKDFRAVVQKTGERTGHISRPSEESCRLNESNIRSQINHIIPRNIHSQGELNTISYDTNRDKCTFSTTTVTNGVQENVKRYFIYDEKTDKSSEIQSSELAMNNHTNTSTKK